ncbi:hypothetical protein FXO37_09961 [Capsicum annuum]|nr:hypothetical protein FXO37_09961 [Capsicum annuum]
MPVKEFSIFPMAPESASAGGFCPPVLGPHFWASYVIEELHNHIPVLTFSLALQITHFVTSLLWSGLCLNGHPKCASLRDNFKGLPWHVKGMRKVLIGLGNPMGNAGSGRLALGAPTRLEAQARDEYVHSHPKERIWMRSKDLRCATKVAYSLAMPADMLIERHQREQTSKGSFPRAQDRAKDLGNKEGWPIVGGTMGTARPLIPPSSMWIDSSSKYPRVIEKPSRDDFKLVGTVCRGILWRHVGPTGVVIFIRNSVSGMLATMVRREHGLDKDVKQELAVERVLCKASTRLALSGLLSRDNVKKDLSAGFFVGKWALKSGGGKSIRWPPQVCCLEGQPQGPALACQRNAQGTHRAREPYGQRRVGWTSIGRPDKARGWLYESTCPAGCLTDGKMPPSRLSNRDTLPKRLVSLAKAQARDEYVRSHPQECIWMRSKDLRYATKVAYMLAMSADMLIKRHQREQTSKGSFPQAQDRAKDLGNEEDWPIVGGNMGAARGQGYDGASNMQGEFNDLKTSIMKDTPSVYSVHCFAHQLQLTRVAVAKKHHEVNQVFDILANVLNVVGGSFKRRDMLRDDQTEKLEELLMLGEVHIGSKLN